MDTTSIDPDRPVSGNRPYSPLLCFSLLLAIGLIIQAAP